MPLAALAAALLLPGHADAQVAVETPREFQRAVEALRGGGTIVLRPGRYARLTIGPRSTRRLVVRARPGATVGRLLLAGTRDVRLENLLVTPARGGALVRIARSRRIALVGVRVRGTTIRKARVVLAGSRGVSIRRSGFRECGDGAVCVLLGRSADVRIVGSRFEDCYGCDFVRGVVTRELVLRGNRFHRALVGPCGSDAATCNHNDLVQLQGGRDVLVERNVFGVYEPPGAGQLYLAGPLDGVVVRDNVFRARDPRLPDLPVPPNGIVLGNRIDTGGRYSALPARVTIAHNTILSGARRGRGAHADLANSLAVSPRYGELPEAQRPLVVNNVLAVTGSPDHLCGAARLERNVTIAGTACSEADALGDPLLTPAGLPTPDSALVIDRGIPGWSVRDLRGRQRDAAPDIGAYEFGG